MVKNESHIDVLFRNGLKNIEVLPPSSVWDDISPEIHKPNSGYVLRIAAGIAVITSLGIMSYLALRGSNELNQPAGQQPIVSEYRMLENNSSVAEDNASLIQEVRGVETEKYVNPGDNSDEAHSVMMQGKLDGSDINNRQGGSDYEIIMKSPVSSLYVDELQNGLTEELKPVKTRQGIFHHERWKIAAMMAPAYMAGEVSGSAETTGQFRNNESATISYSGGLSLSYSMNKRLSFQTGLYFSSYGREVNGLDIYSGYKDYVFSKTDRIFEVETSTGIISTTDNDIYLVDASSDRIEALNGNDNFDPEKADLNLIGDGLLQSFRFVEVPLILRYKVIDRRLDFNIIGGMSYNFMIDNQVSVIQSDNLGAVGETEGYETILMSSSLGMSMEYNLSEKFSFNFEPHLKYFLNPASSLIYNNQYTFGVYSGLSYRF